MSRRLNWEAANARDKRRAARGSRHRKPVIRHPDRKPTKRQLSYLKGLCESQGRPFKAPETREGASALISILQQKK